MILNRLSNDAISMFYRQMGTMLTCGIPLQEAILTLKDDNQNPAIHKMIHSISQDLEQGQNLMDTFSKYPAVFNDILINALQQEKRGEVTGKFLSTLAEEMEKKQALKIKIISAAALPMLTLAVAVVVISIILIFCIPVFLEMFEGMGSTLPAPTLGVIALSEFFIQKGVYLFIPIILMFILLKKRKALRYRILSFFPGMGNLIRKISILMFTRHLGMMLSLNVPLKNALNYSAMNNPLYTPMILDLSESVSHINQLKNAMEALSVFPGMLIQMVTVGTKTDALSHTLSQLSQHYEKDVDRTLSKLLVFGDFFLMLALGLFVGGLVISMYLPIFQLGSIA